MKISFLITLLLYLSSVPAHADVTDGLIGWWKYDESSGNAVDSSGQGNTGTPTGTTIVSGCKRYGCRSFDGTADKIEAAITWTPTRFTVSFWLYPLGVANYDHQIVGGGWGTFVFHTTSLGKIYCGTEITLRFVEADFAANTVAINTWQQFVYTYDGTSGRLYKDGVLLVGPKVQTTSVAWAYFSVGVGNTNTINGRADDVRVYNRALSQNEISAIYEVGRPRITVKGSARIGKFKLNP